MTLEGDSKKHIESNVKFFSELISLCETLQNGFDCVGNLLAFFLNSCSQDFYLAR